MFHTKIFRIGSKALFLALIAGGITGGVAHALDAQQEFPAYSIMTPEPGDRPQARRPRAVAPEVQETTRPARPIRRARGSSTASTIPTYQSPVKPLGVTPRTYDGPQLTEPPRVPRPVPGFATVPPPPTSLSGSNQTFQDRAIGCVQSGASNGIGAGAMGSYTSSCVNSR